MREPATPKNILWVFKRIHEMWHNYVAFDFLAEDNNLVDHLGKLKQVRLIMCSETLPANERTWHNWLATSNAVSWMGVVVTQMAKFEHVVRPKHADMLRHRARLCQILAILVLLVGTYRFFCEQNAICGTGRRASQWSLLVAGLLTLAVGTFFEEAALLKLTSNRCVVLSWPL